MKPAGTVEYGARAYRPDGEEAYALQLAFDSCPSFEAAQAVVEAACVDPGDWGMVVKGRWVNDPDVPGATEYAYDDTFDADYTRFRRGDEVVGEWALYGSEAKAVTP